MAVSLGPVLMFRGLDADKWRLSVLIVTDGAPPTFQCDPAIEIGGFAPLWARGNETAYACRFSVRLGGSPQSVPYSVGAANALFHVPAKGEAPQMAYGSCNGFSSFKAMKGVKDNNRLWRDMEAQHLSIGDPFHLLLLGGDQVYADSMWETVPEMTAWAELDWDRGNQFVPTQRMKDVLSDYYFRLYTSRWAQPDVARMLAQVPIVAMWDDHDLIDGWGSYPGDRQESKVYREAIWPAAYKAFRTFQQQLADGEDHPRAITPGNERGMTFGHQVGPVAILALDLRTERSDRQVMSSTTWNLVYAWIDKLEARHLIVMSSIPIVYPGFDVLERILGFWPGYQDLEDDLKDHWRTRAHKGERLRMVHRLLDTSNSPSKIRPTIISGDVHVAGIGYIESTRAEHIQSAVINQLISSGIVHPGPGGAVLFALRNLFDRPDEMDRGITGRMVEFPGTQDKFAGGRNFLTLRPDKEDRIWANWWIENSTEDPYTKVIHPI